MEIAETIPIHLTQEVEGIRDYNFERMQNLHGVLHGMKWIGFHGLLDFASSPVRRGGSNRSRETKTLISHKTLDLL